MTTPTTTTTTKTTTTTTRKTKTTTTMNTTTCECVVTRDVVYEHSRVKFEKTDSTYKSRR